MIRASLFVSLLLLTLVAVRTSQADDEVPLLGAQVWIEPGQTPQQVDGWFRMLSEHKMPVARLFLMWNYIERQPGQWDFSLYDAAFEAAAKHDVKIVATLTTNRRPVHRGDYYKLHGHDLEDTRERLEESRQYIEKVVSHWKNHPALDSWSLTNEAWQDPTPQPLAIQRFRKWLEQRYGDLESLNAAWSTNFASFRQVVPHESWNEIGYWNCVDPFVDWRMFWRAHVAWWLDGIAREVRKNDPDHPIHAHTSGQARNLARRSTDLPAWNAFSQSLGGTFHPGSSGVGPFDRDHFAQGIAYGCDLLRGSSRPHPFWVTELQAGTNIYSGGRNALTPTQQDIAQWVWTSLGSGADRIIFWLLNHRLHGWETGEWAMIDFQQQPTERLETAGQIASVIDRHRELFADARPVAAPVTLLMSLDTMALQSWVPRTDYVGRTPEAHIIEVSGIYQTLLELGIPVEIQWMHQWDGSAPHARPQLVILPHVTAMDREQFDELTQFVASGNTALLTGHTGLYGPHLENWALAGWPLKRLLGAELANIRLVDETCHVKLQQPRLDLPAHLWIAEIKNHQATVLAWQDDWITATENRLGQGRAVWIPSLIGTGAWTGESGPLAQLLDELTRPFVETLPFRFSERSPDCVLRCLQSPGGYVTIVTNGTAERRSYHLTHRGVKRVRTLWPPSDASEEPNSREEANEDSGREIVLGPRATRVEQWVWEEPMPSDRDARGACWTPPAMPGYERGEVLSREDFSNALADWMPEGDVAARIIDGRLELEALATGPARKGNLWWRRQFDNPFLLEFTYQSATDVGLSMVFWNARGIGGDDVFSWKRSGKYEEYVAGNLTAYHASFHRFGSGVSNIRKAPGFHLVASARDPIPSNSAVVHTVAIASADKRQRLLVDGRLVHDFLDESEPCLSTDAWCHALPCPGTGPHCARGAIGLRHTQKQKAYYDDFKVTRLRPTSARH